MTAPTKNCYIELADKIDLHLTLDHTPGYILTEEDQRVIILALRFVGRPQPAPSPAAVGLGE